MNVYFVSGIDTDVGKTYATGYIAKILRESGVDVVTHKLCQTGADDDALIHSKISSTPQSEFAPQRFSYPASPHLSAKLEGSKFDEAYAKECIQSLSQKHDMVLVEGVGGLMVPLTNSLLQIDFIKEYKVILVTSTKLGSINHTLLSLEALKNRNITIDTLAYNNYPLRANEVIASDTKEFLKAYLTRNLTETNFIEIPFVNL